MLNIFKSYSEKTSMLDDFNFYENREKMLKAKRSTKPEFPVSSFSHTRTCIQCRGYDEMTRYHICSPLILRRASFLYKKYIFCRLPGLHWLAFS